MLSPTDWKFFKKKRLYVWKNKSSQCPALGLSVHGAIARTAGSLVAQIRYEVGFLFETATRQVLGPQDVPAGGGICAPDVLPKGVSSSKE